MNNKANELQVSISDTTELRQMILDNPGLPLIVFAGEDAWRDLGYSYILVDDVRCEVTSVASYNENILEEDAYRDYLEEEMWEEGEYSSFSDEENQEEAFQKAVDDRLKQVVFTDCIVVRIG